MYAVYSQYKLNFCVQLAKRAERRVEAEKSLEAAEEKGTYIYIQKLYDTQDARVLFYYV